MTRMSASHIWNSASSAGPLREDSPSRRDRLSPPSSRSRDDSLAGTARSRLRTTWTQDQSAVSREGPVDGGAQVRRRSLSSEQGGFSHRDGESSSLPLSTRARVYI